MATLSEIAKKLNISKSTVSKALNGRSDVNAETREKILDAVQKLDYSVDIRSQKKLCIYVINIRYDNKNDFGYDIISEFRKKALGFGYSVDVRRVEPDETLEEYENDMKKKNYAGSFIMGLDFNSKILESLKNTVYPTILLDNVVKGDKVACVGSDNMEGVLLAVRYLKNRGHRKIAFCNGSRESYIALQREYAFKHAMARASLDTSKELIAESDFFGGNSDKIVEYLLKSNPTAIICASDMIAVNILKSLEKLKISVPTQISVVGFDNLPVCLETQPPLTSVEQNRKDIGAAAFMGLNCLICGISINSLFIKTKLIKRQSVAPLGEPK